MLTKCLTGIHLPSVLVPNKIFLDILKKCLLKIITLPSSSKKRCFGQFGSCFGYITYSYKVFSKYIMKLWLDVCLRRNEQTSLFFSQPYEILMLKKKIMV